MPQPANARNYQAEVDSARKRLAQVGQWVEDFAHDLASDHAASIIYVFDTDVITMYSRPALNAYCTTLLRSDTQSRSAFRDREEGATAGTELDEIEIALADLLGNHIVWGREIPAFTSPAHKDELASVCGQVWIAASAQLPALTETLLSNFREISKTFPHEADEHAKRAWIEEKIGGIVKSIEDQAPQAVQGLRLQQAFDLERIYSIDGYRSSTANSIDAAFLPSAYDESGDYSHEILALSKQLLQILVSGNSLNDYRMNRMRDDATAIAHLCWLNTQLEAGGRPERLRLVTGGMHLHRLKDGGEEIKSKLPHELKKILVRLTPELKDLIRHPLGFLEDQGIRNLLAFEQSAAGKYCPGGRLGAFLADRISPAKQNEHDTAMNDAGKKNQHGQAEELFTSTVTVGLDLLRAANTRLLVQPERTWVWQLVEDILIHNAGEWDGIIKKHISALLPKFLAGLATIQADTHRHSVTRNLPPLALISPTQATKFCQSLYRDYKNASIPTKETRKLLSKVIDEDRTFYTPLLVIALWRAMDKDWKGARSLADSACSIADRLVADRASEPGSLSSFPETGVFSIFGEEAYYLRAATMRITAGKFKARQLDDLAKALEDISVAEERLSSYQTAFGKPTKQDARFCSERLSIELTIRLYKRLEEKPEFDFKKERTLFDGGSDLLDALNSATSGMANFDYRTHYVYQQICVSLAQLLLLDRYAVSGFEVFPLVVGQAWSKDESYSGKIEKLWESIDKQCNYLISDAHEGIATPTASSLVKVVWRVLGLELGKTPKSSFQSIRDELAENVKSEQRVAAIDNLRFNFLDKIAKRHLSFI